MPATVPAGELSSIDFSSMIGGPLRAVIEAQAQAALTSVEFIKAVGFLPQDPMGNWDGQETAEPIYITFRYPKEVQPYVPAQPAAITGIAITSAGSGYTSPPAVDITGGGGSGASAQATINAAQEVAGVVLTNPGSGYTSAPSVAFSGGGGTGATATATFQQAVDATPAVFQEMKLSVPILSILPVPYIRVEEATIDFNAKINSVEYARTTSTFTVGGTMNYNFGGSIGAAIPIKVGSLGGKLSTGVNMKVSLSYQQNTTSGYKVDRTYSMNVHVRAVQDEMPAGLERLLGILEDSIQSQPVDA